MPLQNRVDPFGDILALPVRGTMTGNRGGRIHDDAQRLTRRRWTSRRWICCELEFRGLTRRVMSEGYTELFFLDEVTALAAGHRPCFFCRRGDAAAFAKAFGGGPIPPGADEMDAILHAERLEGAGKRLHRVDAAGLPDGAVALVDGVPHAMRGDVSLRWTPPGWEPGVRRPSGEVAMLTPPSIAAALSRGFRPRWHPSAA